MMVRYIYRWMHGNTYYNGAASVQVYWFSSIGDPTRSINDDYDRMCQYMVNPYHGDTSRYTEQTEKLLHSGYNYAEARERVMKKIYEMSEGYV